MCPIHCICNYCQSGNKYGLYPENAYPNLTIVPNFRQFKPPRECLALNFKTKEPWETIKEKVEKYFDENSIGYCLPDTNAIFSVSKNSSDSILIFDINVCPMSKETELELQKYVIEFRRIRGDAFILSSIFSEIKALFVKEENDVEKEN